MTSVTKLLLVLLCFCCFSAVKATSQENENASLTQKPSSEPLEEHPPELRFVLNTMEHAAKALEKALSLMEKRNPSAQSWNQRLRRETALL